MCFASNKMHQEAFASLRIKPPGLDDMTCMIRLKIDSGASGNALTTRTLKQMYGEKALESSHIQPVPGLKLTAYSGHEILCHGKINIKCQHLNKKDMFQETFYIVEAPGPCVVGLPTGERLGLITINVDTVNNLSKHIPEINEKEDLKKHWPSCFSRPYGDFPAADLYPREDAEPSIDGPRKWSINMLPRIKEKITSMVEDNVIRKLRPDEHSDWCSSMAYSVKKDGSLRICIDPQKLNSALKRNPYKIPTVEEINPKLAGAKVFSKLDAKSGYWSVPLGEKSQLLTTFRTPFGCYCWLRLPFGLRVSQDIFQERMDDILGDLEGVVNISDDTFVFGIYEADHDKNLAKLMDCSVKNHVVYNYDKCEIKKPAITFFGNHYNAMGITPDPKKKYRESCRCPHHKTKRNYILSWA